MAIFLARGWINDAVNNQYEQSRSDVKTQPVKNIETMPVLVADTVLKFGDRLSPQNVRIAEYPVSAIPEGSYTNFEQLFKDDNQPLVLTQIVANEPLLSFKLSGAGGRAILSTRITENMRAVAIRVTDVSGVAGFVQPGDAVDVLLTQEIELAGFDSRSKQSSKEVDYKTDLLIQNVKVLGADQSAEMVEGVAIVVKTMTLEVSLQQAQKLALARKVGDLSLSLRHAGSTEQALAASLRVSDLGVSKPMTARLKRWAKTKPVPVKRAAPRTIKKSSGTAKVTVIRNGEYERETVFKETPPETQMAGGSL